MAGSKPPPQTLEPDDERKIQIFLERASSIVLQHSVLDTRHWRSLVALAEELELSEEQLRSTVNDLRQRGVITEIDLSPSKPPPLPSQAARKAPETKQEPVADVDFTLTPPPPPKPRETKPNTTKSLPPPPPTETKPVAPPPPPEKTPSVSKQQALQPFLQRATEIIAEQRGFGTQTQTLLAAAAKEMGLDDGDFARALRELGPQSTPPPPSASDSVTESGRRRWRVEGEPDPEPPPPPADPEGTFRDYLRGALTQTKGEVTELQQKRLVRHGMRVLGLAQVFARHILAEETEAKGLRLDSVQAADEPEQLSEPELKLFLDRSVPILAQHRGINAKSRVLLNALAQELGLSEQQVERAIALAQFRASTVDEEVDAKQQERLDGFRELAQGTLVSLPKKLLTSDIERELIKVGEHRHGIRPQLLKSAIRDVCAALEIRQVSEQQARMHIVQLVDMSLAESSHLSMEVRLRIQSQGDHWGLNSVQVAEIIKQRTREHQRRRKAEQNLSDGALYLAAFAALLVVCLFGWIVFSNNRSPDDSDDTVAVEPTGPGPPAVNEDEMDASWLGENVNLLVIARRNLAQHERVFLEIESTDPSVRRSAYTSLVSVLLRESTAAEDVRRLQDLLIACYQKDPDDEAARKIRDELLERLPGVGSELSEDKDLYLAMFRAAQATVALVSQSADDRQSQAAVDLGRVIGRSVDVRAKQMDLEKECLQALAEQLYQMLLEAARAQPTLVSGVYNAVSNATFAHLDDARRQKLNTDFLVTVLTSASTTWRRYEDLIAETILSEDAVNAARLLEVYEKTTNAKLQEFMGGKLLRRAGVAPPPREVAEIASQVRKALDISDVMLANGRANLFIERAGRILAAPAANENDSEQLIREVVGLAYHSTLGSVASAGTSGEETFDSLAEQQPDSLLEPKEEDSPFKESKPPMTTATLRTLDQRLLVLNPRTSAVERARAIASLGELVPRVPHLEPDKAAHLASYLVYPKEIEEHRRVIADVPKLAKWKRVRLGVADRIATSEIKHDQLQELASKLLGREYVLREGSAGREALRVELLRDVLADVGGDDVEQDSKLQLFDRAAQALYDLYVTQAVILRVAEWEEEPATPSVVLQAMIGHVATDLKNGKLDAGDKQTVDSIDTELRAIDYLATNDLQRLALLERSWLRLLAIRVAQQHPQRAADAQDVVEQLSRSDRKASQVLVQLRGGQSAILEMWVLLNRTE
jgi:hypothetical protein